MQGRAIEAVRWALVLVLLGFGYIKFFAFEVEAVAPLIAAHPALSWQLAVLGKAGASAFLGVFEITTGVLLAIGARIPLAGLIGGLMSSIIFTVTVSLLFFLPGIFEPSAGGFPAISGTGAFLLKDVVLLAASILLALNARTRMG